MMATYLELRGMFNDSDLSNKMAMAVVISAYDILQGTPTADDRTWVAAVLSNPKAAGNQAHMAVLAANKGLTTTAILSAADSVIQSQVDAIVPSLVKALAGV